MYKFVKDPTVITAAAFLLYSSAVVGSTRLIMGADPYKQMGDPAKVGQYGVLPILAFTNTAAGVVLDLLRRGYDRFAYAAKPEDQYNNHNKPTLRTGIADSIKDASKLTYLWGPSSFIFYWFMLINQGSGGVYGIASLAKSTWPLLVGNVVVAGVLSLAAFAVYKQWRFLETSVKAGVFAATVAALGLLLKIRIHQADYDADTITPLDTFLWIIAACFGGGGLVIALGEQAYRYFFPTDSDSPIAHKTFRGFDLAANWGYLNKKIDPLIKGAKKGVSVFAGLVGAASIVLLFLYLGWLFGINQADNNPKSAFQPGFFAWVVNVGKEIGLTLGLLAAAHPIWSYLPFFARHESVPESVTEEHKPLLGTSGGQQINLSHN